MNKIKKILPWLALALYMIIMLSITSKKHDNVVCKKIVVSIKNKSENKFIQEKDVISLLNKKSIIGKKMSDINTNEIEKILTEYPNIKDANVFRNLSGKLKIEVTPKKPIARIINKTKKGYYIDQEGFVLPLSDKYTAHVLIVSGDIDEPYNKWNKRCLKQDKIKIVENYEGILFDLFLLINYIYHDKFWNAQIEQIYVKNKEFELVPRVGTQNIIFGNVDNYLKKFEKLKTFYIQGTKQAGWNKYKTINLKYDKQIICTKR